MKSEAYFPSENWIKKTLGSIYGTSDYQELYAQMSANDAKVKNISEDNFNTEYLAAKLAVSVISWEECCDENKIQNEEYKKSFLKKIMEHFQSSKFMPLATAFSEYLYAPDKENKELPVLAMTQKFFERLKLDMVVEAGHEKKEISENFKKLLAILDAFRTSFHQDFYTSVGD